MGFGNSVQTDETSSVSVENSVEYSKKISNLDKKIKLLCMANRYRTKYIVLQDGGVRKRAE